MEEESALDENSSGWEKEPIAALMAGLAHASEEQVVPFVGAALDRGMSAQLEQYLSELIRKKDMEIDQACNKYFGDFLTSAQNMVEMKEDAEELRFKVKDLDDGLQKSGKEYLQLGETILRFKDVKLKINETKELMQQALEIVDLVAAAEAHVQDCRYFIALDTLDSVKQKVVGVRARPLAQLLETSVPALTERVKHATLEQVSTWLVTAREQAQGVGETALCRCAWQGTEAGTMTSGSSVQPSVQGKATQGVPTRKDEAAVATATFSLRFLHRFKDTVGLDLTDLGKGEISSWVPEFLLVLKMRGLEHSEFLDTLSERLAPIHRALHIFQRLGDIYSFKEFYVSSRKAQAEFASLAPGADLRSIPCVTFLQVFPAFVQRLAGFFLIEDAVLAAADYPAGLMTKPELEELWEKKQDELVMLLRDRLCEVSDPNQFIQVKEIVFVLSRTIGQDGLQLRTSPLISFLMKMWPTFHTIHIAHLEMACRCILIDETNQPMKLESDEQLLKLKRLGLVLEDEEQDAEEKLQALEARRMPKGKRELPVVHFSASVPKIAQELLKITIRSLFYSASVSSFRVGKALMVAISGALDHVREIITDLLQTKDIPISQVVQISLNCSYLAKLPFHLQELVCEGISAMLWEEVEGEDSSVLAIRSGIFEQLASTAHAATFELIQGKLVDLIGGVHFVNFEPKHIASSPSPYIEDVTGFLQVTFMCLNQLSITDREGIYFASCSFIHTHLMLHLTEQVPKINMYGIANLSKDVQALEHFADLEGIAGLSECFAELRQFCDVLLNPNFAAIIVDPESRAAYYPKVDPAKLISVLQKFENLSTVAKVKRREGVSVPSLDKKDVHAVLRELQAQGF